jgi:hypothetical protein
VSKSPLWKLTSDFPRLLALEAMRRALALAGATPADVVKLNVYTTDCRAFHKTQAIWPAGSNAPPLQEHGSGQDQQGLRRRIFQANISFGEDRPGDQTIFTCLES